MGSLLEHAHRGYHLPSLISGQVTLPSTVADEGANGTFEVAPSHSVPVTPGSIEKTLSKMDIRKAAVDRITPTFSQLYDQGHFGRKSTTLASPGGLLDLLVVDGQAGDISRPAVSDLVLYQELRGGSRLNCDFGEGKQTFTVQRGTLVLAPPDTAIANTADAAHRVRSIAFPLMQWSSFIDQATDGKISFSRSFRYGKLPDSPAIRTSLQNLWSICDLEGAPSNLLARAAGCQIIAELCRLGGVPLESPKGGLASWAERRSKELIHTCLSQDISLDFLASEVQLSPYHFSRMFKRSVGLSPRAYLSKIRIEKACELLEFTNMSILDISLEVGYSSSQCFSKIFFQHMHVRPSDYRRAIRFSIGSA